MNRISKPGLFPWFSLLTGLIGLSMQSVMLSAVDRNGLLPAGHFGGVVSFILLAVTLGTCFLTLRRASFSHAYGHQFPKSYIAAAGNVLGAAGMIYCTVTQSAAGVFGILLRVLGALSGVVLLVMAYCRAKGQRPNYLLRCVVTVYLLLRTVACCRDWGAEPQLQLFFFPLMASLFLAMASYYHTELDAKNGDCRRYFFMSQAALFCCCLSIPGEGGLFYLFAGIWMAADHCVLPAQE